MNSSTRLRLAKEARALLPFWAALAGLIAVPFLLLLQRPMDFAMPAFWLGCALLGSVVFGQEFQHRTMGLLLTQPVSRRRLWWEKMFVLGVASFGLLLWMVIFSSLGAHYLGAHFAWNRGVFGLSDSLLLPLIFSFCTGPVLTLLARSTMGGLVLMSVCPSVFFLCWVLLLAGFDYEPSVPFLSCSRIFAFGLYPGALFLLGCRRFQRLEDIHGHGQELSLPAALTRSFAGFTERLTLNHGGALGQLVRKEVRLHLPAFVVAGMFVGLWMLLLAVVSARLSMSKEFLLLPAVWLGLGIPVVAGIVSTAEERGLGLLDWHLTLPVSARRQWFVKVIVALAVNVVLGILLPGVLGYAASWLVGGTFDMNLDAKDSQAFLIANAVIFCAALCASTAASNSTRALVGTIVLFLAGAMVLNFADYIYRWFPVKWTTYSPDWNERPGGVASLFFWIDQYRWLLGWSSLAVWLYFLGLTGFRRSLESFSQPVRRMAVFFAVVCAFVFAAIVLRFDYASLHK